MTKKYSIVIPTYNHCNDLLKPCLESVLLYTDLNSAEIIVVANGCVDNTIEYLNDKPVKTIVSAEPLGYPKAVNTGIRESIGEYIVLLNNDTILLDQPQNQWLEIMEAPFKKDPMMGITGPFKHYEKFAGEQFIIFFCAMIRRTVFEKIGLLREEFGLGFGEDVLFSVLAQRAGFGISQVPSDNAYFDENNRKIGAFPIYHEGHQTIQDIPHKKQQIEQNRIWLLNNINTKGVKLNIGCGDRPEPDYINIDLYVENVDIQADARKLPLKDCVANEIKAIHLIEHINPYHVFDMLKEWFRVLKPGGKLIIECPNIEELCKAFVHADKSQRYHILNCMFGTGTVHNPHIYGWYPEILIDHLLQAGFIMPRVMEQQYPHWGINMRIECERPLMLPDGFFSDLNAQTYRSLVSRIPDHGTMIEIGTWKGRSICYLANIIRMKQLNVHCIDSFMGTLNSADTIEQQMVEEAKSNNIRHICEQFMQHNHIDAFVTIHQNDSITASQNWPANSVDLIFIDADHSEEAVYRDISAWYPKLKSGGIIAGHDIEWPSVAAAVSRFFNGCYYFENGIWYVIKTAKPRIIDCFTFFNELELLEIRLAELYPVVDYFLLVEGSQNMYGQQKPLYFAENKNKFAQYLDKIIHVPITEYPVCHDTWERERYQREILDQKIREIAKEDDILIISDLDEIPSRSAVQSFVPEMGFRCFNQKLYYYYLNCYSQDWQWAKIITYREYQKFQGASHIRYTQAPLIENGGWHFSFQGGVQRIIQKIESWSHSEYNTAEFKDPKWIEECMNTPKDIFKRPDINLQFVPVDNSWPSYVVQNMQHYIDQGWIKI